MACIWGARACVYVCVCACGCVRSPSRNRLTRTSQTCVFFSNYLWGRDHTDLCVRTRRSAREGLEGTAAAGKRQNASECIVPSRRLAGETFLIGDYESGLRLRFAGSEWPRCRKVGPSGGLSLRRPALWSSAADALSLSKWGSAASGWESCCLLVRMVCLAVCSHWESPSFLLWTLMSCHFYYELCYMSLLSLILPLKTVMFLILYETCLKSKLWWFKDTITIMCSLVYLGMFKSAVINWDDIKTKSWPYIHSIEYSFLPLTIPLQSENKIKHFFLLCITSERVISLLKI